MRTFSQPPTPPLPATLAPVSLGVIEASVRPVGILLGRLERAHQVLFDLAHDLPLCGFSSAHGAHVCRVTVSDGAGVLAPYLAESVTGAMLALGCGFLNYVEQQRARQWKPVAVTPLRDRTLLVVGFGRIGECVARNPKALGMRVLAIRGTPAPHPAADEMHGPDALPALLPRADFVSLHVRLNAATRAMLSREGPAAMRPGAYLVNTSRGPVVDEAALVDALRSGHLAGAYLDVFETEPLPAESPLWAMHGKFVLIVGVESCASSTRRRAFIAALSHVRRRISP